MPFKTCQGFWAWGFGNPRTEIWSRDSRLLTSPSLQNRHIMSSYTCIKMAVIMTTKFPLGLSNHSLNLHDIHVIKTESEPWNTTGQHYESTYRIGLIQYKCLPANKSSINPADKRSPFSQKCYPQPIDKNAFSQCSKFCSSFHPPSSFSWNCHFSSCSGPRACLIGGLRESSH